MFKILFEDFDEYNGYNTLEECLEVFYKMIKFNKVLYVINDDGDEIYRFKNGKVFKVEE